MLDAALSVRDSEKVGEDSTPEVLLTRFRIPVVQDDGALGMDDVMLLNCTPKRSSRQTVLCTFYCSLKITEAWVGNSSAGGVPS